MAWIPPHVLSDFNPPPQNHTMNFGEIIHRIVTAPAYYENLGICPVKKATMKLISSIGFVSMSFVIDYIANLMIFIAPMWALFLKGVAALTMLGNFVSVYLTLAKRVRDWRKPEDEKPKPFVKPKSRNGILSLAITRIVIFVTIIFAVVLLMFGCNGPNEKGTPLTAQKTDVDSLKERIEALESMTIYVDSQMQVLTGRIGYMDTLLQAYKDDSDSLKKQYNLDYAKNSEDLDSLFSIINRITRQKAIEEGRLKWWKRAGRNARSFVDAYKEIKELIPLL